MQREKVSVQIHTLEKGRISEFGLRSVVMICGIKRGCSLAADVYISVQIALPVGLGLLSCTQDVCNDITWQLL